MAYHVIPYRQESNYGPPCFDFLDNVEARDPHQYSMLHVLVTERLQQDATHVAPICIQADMAGRIWECKDPRPRRGRVATLLYFYWTDPLAPQGASHYVVILNGYWKRDNSVDVQALALAQGYYRDWRNRRG